MPSFDMARRIASTKNNGAKTLGQIHKEKSDFVMEYTWDNDIQSKVCYIYDYFHDDQKNKKDHMTYKNTTKTQIDAKFIVKSYQSIDKDRIEYYVQFKPSQKTEFSTNDELYYFETDYRQKYNNDDFVGLYLDIPDEKGVYRKWLIVKREVGNQFIKYLVLPCNYEFMWIERNKQERIKRKMWCVLRSQNSYNSGLWEDDIFTTTENQKKCWLPMNVITEKIWYTSSNNQNMRVLVSAFTDKPIAWNISKVENTNEFGIQMLTLYQDFFNQHVDFIEKDKDGNIIGLWADYYDSDIIPLEHTNESNTLKIIGKINASSSIIKVGGSYKTLTLKIYDTIGTEITDYYSNALFNWYCYVDEINITNEQSLITWRSGEEFNKQKIKFSNNRSYLDKILEVKCEVILDNEKIESVMKFDLSI